jgi:hypothetical protein
VRSWPGVGGRRAAGGSELSGPPAAPAKYNPERDLCSAARRAGAGAAPVLRTRRASARRGDRGRGSTGRGRDERGGNALELVRRGRHGRGRRRFGLAVGRATSAYSKQSRVTLFFVPVIAATLYTALGMGQGLDRGRRGEGDLGALRDLVHHDAAAPQPAVPAGARAAERGHEPAPCQPVHDRTGSPPSCRHAAATGCGTRSARWPSSSSSSPSSATSHARPTGCPTTCARSSCGCATSMSSPGSATRSCGRSAPRGSR